MCLWREDEVTEFSVTQYWLLDYRTTTRAFDTGNQDYPNSSTISNCINFREWYDKRGVSLQKIVILASNGGWWSEEAMTTLLCMLVGVYHNWVIGDDPEWSPAYVTQTAFNVNLHYPFNL
ncbi:hypothetical protein CBL_10452 [Carabus blaptoides fortunei]